MKSISWDEVVVLTMKPNPFKVGDKVLVLNNEHLDYQIGDEVVVTEIMGRSICFNSRRCLYFHGRFQLSKPRKHYPKRREV